jgi:gluconokinase
MGVSGAGKSTLGIALSEQLHCPFIEGDTLHSAHNVAKMSAGVALTDEDRWPWLDRVGGALREAVRTHGAAVAACSALKRVYRERLSAAAAMPLSLLWLHAGEEILPARLRGRSGHFMPPELLASQLATLESPAPPEHWLELDAARPVQMLVDEALRWLRRTTPALK